MWQGLTEAGGRKVALLALMLLAPAYGAAAATITLDGLGSNGVVFIEGGKSRTIQFTDSTTFAVCLDEVTGNVPLPSIADGSSNTLLFGENTGFGVRAGRVTPRVPISQISDGTSNTIIIGEIENDSLCLADSRVLRPDEITDGTSNTIIIGETSEFDVCFRGVRVGNIVDGTSNTIVFGEVTQNPVCFNDVRVPVAEVPAPSALALLSVGLLGLGYPRRRRRSDHSQ